MHRAYRRSKFIISCASSHIPFLVAQNCHGTPVVQKIVRLMGIKANNTRAQNKAHGVCIENCGPSFLTPLENPVRSASAFQNDREADMSVTQRFQSQAADFYDTASHFSSDSMTNVSIPEVNMLKNSSTLAVSVPLYWVLFL